MAKAMQRVNGLGLIESEPELKIPFHVFLHENAFGVSGDAPSTSTS